MPADKYGEILNEISTIDKEEREKVVKLFEYFDIEFDNIVWNHPNLQIVDIFRKVKRYWYNAKYIVENCEEELKRFKQKKQSDKQKSVVTAEEKEESLAACQGYRIKDIIDSVPKGGKNE